MGKCIYPSGSCYFNPSGANPTFLKNGDDCYDYVLLLSHFERSSLKLASAKDLWKGTDIVLTLLQKALQLSPYSKQHEIL